MTLWSFIVKRQSLLLLALTVRCSLSRAESFLQVLTVRSHIDAAVAHTLRSLESPAEGPSSVMGSLRLSDGFQFGGVHVAEAGEVMSHSEPSALTLSSGGGVLCQTLLHKKVHDKHFMPFAEGGLGKSLASGLDQELQKQCKAAFKPSEWRHLKANYTGSWSDHQVSVLDNTLFGSLGAWLNDERQKVQESASTWDSFRNGEDSSTFEGLIRHIARGPIVRVLDFGCGDGVELAKIARGFGLGPADAFGLDIRDAVSSEVQTNITFFLAETAEDAYAASLEAYLNKGVRGTVSAIFSSVTFHHITQPALRTAALNFVKEALSPDGFFLFAEWDNIGTPIDYSIYFDLAHYLPMLFFSNPAPTKVALLPMDTDYLSVQGWMDLMSANGLPCDAERSTFPFTTQDNQTVMLDPVAAADRSSGRNFLAVFTKAS